MEGALHTICTNANVTKEMIHLFLDNDANIDIKDQVGCTPLYHALLFVKSKENKIEEVVTTLIERGCSINIISDQGHMPLEFCMISSILKDMMKLLISKGADINLQNKELDTPFFSYCSFEAIKYDILLFLIENGANLKLKNINGHTPLHLLCHNLNVTVEMIEIMINSGAEINAETNEGNTPLFFLYHRNEIKKKEILYMVDKGANINQRCGNSGYTIFHILCRSSQLTSDFLKALIDRGADLNEETADRDCAIHLICGNPSVNIEMLKILVEADCDVNAKGCFNTPPLRYLCHHTTIHEDEIMFLIDQGAVIWKNEKFASGISICDLFKNSTSDTKTNRIVDFIMKRFSYMTEEKSIGKIESYQLKFSTKKYLI